MSLKYIPRNRFNSFLTHGYHVVGELRVERIFMERREGRLSQHDRRYNTLLRNSLERVAGSLDHGCIEEWRV